MASHYQINYIIYGITKLVSKSIQKRIKVLLQVEFSLDEDFYLRRDVWFI